MAHSPEQAAYAARRLGEIEEDALKERRQLEDRAIAARRLLASEEWIARQLAGLDELRGILDGFHPTLGAELAVFTLGRAHQLLEQLFEPEAILRRYDDLERQLSSSSPKTT